MNTTNKLLFAIGLGLVTVGGVAAATHRGGANAGGDRLDSLRAQYRTLQAQVEPCIAQMNAGMSQTALGAMNGEMIDARPACAAMMPQWTAQAAVLEKEIYQAQTGANVSVNDFVLAPQASPSGSTSEPIDPEAGHDDGLAAVERYDRQVIRGNGIYAEDDGTEHELPLAPNYYQNPSSGDIVPTELPEAPSDGRDWQQLQQQD